MKIIPIAFDSFSVRSQCTLVKTSDVNILIDPSVAIAPRRYGMPPSKKEMQHLEKSKKEIMKASKNADIIIISHYHYDHIPYPEDEKFTKVVFHDKIVYAKDIHKFINYSQRDRGREFENNIKKLAKQFEYVDSKQYKHKKTTITFSKPVFHGPMKTKLGYVIMCAIKNKKDVFVYGSDAQGPIDMNAVKFIKEHNPNELILDGPLTYMLGFRFKQSDLRKSIENMKKIIDSVRAKKIIYDHHLTRDLKYKEKIKEIIQYAKKNKKKIVTAAEYLKIKNRFLEARRKELCSSLAI